MDYFNMPIAGYRNYRYADHEDAGQKGLYWSSTPSTEDAARSLGLIGSSVLSNDYNSRGNGLSVRCFKNEYIPLVDVYTATFDVQ